MPASGPLPRTELPHPRTHDLDRLPPADLARLLAEIDDEAFAGLLAEPVLAGATALVRLLCDRPPPVLVLAGAGTSGRLAFLLARHYEAALLAHGVRLQPWIAGGPRALARAVEGAEDDTAGAQAEIRELVAARDSVLVGISCGLSAPCVAAGVRAALDLGRHAVVFGTNSVDAARSAPLPGLPAGFHGVLRELLASGAGLVLTPDVGPEALTGSTRLKGGTATWLLFDAVLAAVAAGERDASASIRSRLETARRTCASGQLLPIVAAAIEAAGTALRGDGRVVYAGLGEPGLAGLLDASECPPTFGASPERVRGFVARGWQAWLGEDPAAARLEAEQPVTLEWCRENMLPRLTDHDVLIEVGERPVLAGAATAGRRLHLPASNLLAAKLALNAISTGAFVRAGKVWENRMIDLVPSNGKLIDRACRIVRDLAAVSDDAARRALVAALWDEDPPPLARLRLPAEVHASKARPGVVPLALLLARGLRLEEARAALASEPIAREVLRRLS